MNGHLHHQVDLFFASLAEARGKHAIGVILSGALSDGTAGCREIKLHGGTTFAQDGSARVATMPRSAREAGMIDRVLAPTQIAAAIWAIASGCLV
jgi:two-component system, chemotaxis family, CheB/CheR fusion protein